MAIQTPTGLTARLFRRTAVPASHQWRRQFSASRTTPKEIQDAYILSAARTPTARVFNPLFQCYSLLIDSSTAPSSLYPPLNSAPSPSSPRSKGPASPSRK